MKQPFDAEAFRKKLEEQLSFPTVYLFKFIIQADNRKIAMIEQVFPPEAEILSKASSGGKYLSISAKMVVTNAEEVVAIYRQISEIEGVIAL